MRDGSEAYTWKALRCAQMDLTGAKSWDKEAPVSRVEESADLGEPGMPGLDGSWQAREGVGMSLVRSEAEEEYLVGAEGLVVL